MTNLTTLHHYFHLQRFHNTEHGEDQRFHNIKHWEGTKQGIQGDCETAIKIKKQS
ncbi:hypothetical protein R6Q59_035829 [Mikania micrantha]